MRGCLTLLVGVILGAALMLLWWPHQPAGTAAPASSDVRVTISDAYLSRRAEQRVSTLGGANISGVTVVSAPPVALVTSASVGVGPVAAPVTLQLQPVAESGVVRVRVISANVAGIPVPAALVGAVADSINSSTRRLMASGSRVMGVEVIPGALEIFLTYR